jgi:hypothetical protein
LWIEIFCDAGHQTLLKAEPINANKNNTTKIKNNSFATPAAATAIPVKPNTAAISAMMKNAKAHLSISASLANPATSACAINFAYLTQREWQVPYAALPKAP